MSDQKRNQGQPKSRPQQHKGTEIVGKKEATFEYRDNKNVINRVNPTFISKPKEK